MLTIHDWQEHQTYRKDRSPPPWIKIHRRIFMSTKWARLSDAEKGQIVSLWILAADNNGNIPSDPVLLRKLAMLDSEPNISKFIELGLMASSGRQDDVKMTPSGCQSDAPEAEAEAEAEEKKHPPASPAPDDPWKEFFDEAKTVLGEEGRSLAGKLKAVVGEPVEAFIVLDQCRDKEQPRAYFAATIRNLAREKSARDAEDLKHREMVERQEKRLQERIAAGLVDEHGRTIR